jgi:cell shape-determining protein MreC
LDDYLSAGISGKDINTNIIAFSINNTNKTIQINNGSKVRIR